jgi:hypothetical protein
MSRAGHDGVEGGQPCREAIQLLAPLSKTPAPPWGMV